MPLFDLVFSWMRCDAQETVVNVNRLFFFRHRHHRHYRNISSSSSRSRIGLREFLDFFYCLIIAGRAENSRNPARPLHSVPEFP